MDYKTKPGYSPNTIVDENNISLVVDVINIEEIEIRSTKRTTQWFSYIVVMFMNLKI